MFLMSRDELSQGKTEKKIGKRAVGVTGTVDMTVMAFVRLVLDMRGVDCDASRLLLRCFVDL